MIIQKEIMSVLLMTGVLCVLGTTFVVAAYTPPPVVRLFGKQVIRCLEVMYKIITHFSYTILKESFTRFGKDMVAFMRQIVEDGLVKQSFLQYKFDEEDLLDEDPLEEHEAPPKRKKIITKKWMKPRPDSPTRAHSRYNLRRRPKQTPQ